MSFFCLAFAEVLFVLFLSGFFLTKAQNGGFSLELIHRDSPKSPFYNLEETPFQRVKNAARRSFNHANRFDPTFVSADPNAAQADIISNGGEYLMNISIGTPPFEILSIVDTGSDLIWTQCNPCIPCYRQEAPLFNPKMSATYEDVSCHSTQCASLEDTVCLAWLAHETCVYSVSYGDGAFSNGILAIDTVTLSSTSNQPVALPNTTFGCGHNDLGTLDAKATGVVGLGGGDVSLITQMSDLIDGRFSYCLVPPESSEDGITSKINFGSNGVVSGSGVISTPLIVKDPKTYYFLTLKAISVGNKSIAFDGSSFGTTEGNIVIDSGTMLALMPQEFNSKLVSSVANSIDAEPIEDPDGLFDLCYFANPSTFKPPKVTVHFSGADVKLSTLNTFIPTSEEIVCFTFKGVDGPAIYGNMVQTNFLIGYDTQKQSVSFKRTDCTEK